MSVTRCITCNEYPWRNYDRPQETAIYCCRFKTAFFAKENDAEKAWNVRMEKAKAEQVKP